MTRSLWAAAVLLIAINTSGPGTAAPVWLSGAEADSAARTAADAPANGVPSQQAQAAQPPESAPSSKAAPPPKPQRTPREALATFVRAMEARDYQTAAEVLDYSALASPPNAYQKVQLAERLKACLDRLALVDAEQIPDRADGPPVPFPPDKADARVRVARGEDGHWRFSADTVAGIDALYEVLKDKPVLGETPTETADSGAGKPDDGETTSSETTDETKQSAPQVPAHLKSARRTMRTLFESLERKDYAGAIATLDFSELEQERGEIGRYTRIEYARRLKFILERMARIDYAEIPDDPEAPTFRFPPDAVNRPILIERGEAGIWRFSPDTVARIDALHELYLDKPVVNLAEHERPWYDRELVLHNETWRILVLFGVIFLSLFVGNLLRTGFRWRVKVLEQRDHQLRAVVTKTLARTVVGICFLIGLHAGVQVLVLDHEVESIASTVIHVVFTLVVGYILFRLVDVAVEMLRQMAHRTGSTLNDMLVPIVSASLRVTIIVLVVLEIATAISDQPPSAVIAGLGTTGLAVGLAAQDMIKNFFGSLMIYADRPFELGDRIVVDGHDGPVEAVGFRSTRIRTLDGHLVTVPNGELAHKTLHNIGKRPYIRRVLDLRIAYDTPPEKVREALRIVRELLDNHEGMQPEYPPRVFLHEFQESAITIRAIYWYHPPAYWDYCNYGERLNLQIIERFRAAAIPFALPAQRLFLADRGESVEGG